MKRPGQIVLFRFPQADFSAGKLRPALLLGQVPGPYNADFDELIGEGDADFSESGLKGPSVIRVGRLAIVEDALLLGSTGEIGSDRLARIRRRLSEWIGSE